jgi:hypothetical protein
MYQPLIPQAKAASQVVSLDVVKSLLLNTSNPPFASECARFIEGFLTGDEVVEYCTNIQDWRAGSGRAGFHIIRDGQVVADLIVRMS